MGGSFCIHSLGTTNLPVRRDIAHVKHTYGPSLLVSGNALSKSFSKLRSRLKGVNVVSTGESRTEIVHLRSQPTIKLSAP